MAIDRRDFLQKTLLASLSPVAAAAPFLPKNEAEKGETADDFDLEKSQNGTLTLLQTTDVHCQIRPHDELFWENERAVFRKTGGYAHLATLGEKTRKANPNTFLIDTGDMFQGSQLSIKTQGKAISPILDALGYDLYLPGNWEVVYYKKAMQQLLGGLAAPKVCANMFHEKDGKAGALVFPPYYIWTRLGVKIGFIGLTDHLVPLRQSPNYSKGIVYGKPEECLAEWVTVLKEQENCQRVIVLAHLGLSQQINLANLDCSKGVDWILGGDTHERVREPIVCKNARVVEPGAFGSFVGRLDFEVENGKIIADRYELLEVDPKKYRAKKSVTALIDAAEKPFLASIEKVVGHSTVPLYRYFVIENTIDTLILDALEWQTKKAGLGIDVVLSNGFRFCPPRSERDATGNVPITEGFLFDMLPIDSTVRTAEASGKQLLEWLEKELNNVFAKDAAKRFGGWVVKFRGMEVEFLAFGEAGKRVQKAEIGGQKIDPEKIYKVCACERDGDPETMLCRIPSVRNGQNTPFSLHVALKNYLAAASPVTPTPHRSARALDASAELLTQVSGVAYAFR